MPNPIDAGKVYLDVAFDGRQISRALTSPVQAAGRDVERQLSRSFGASAQTAGRALTRNLTPAMVGLGAASLAAFAQVDGGLDAIRATTGATGAELQALERIAKNVGGTVTAGFAQVGQAVGDLAASTDLAGKSLEAVTRQVLQLEQVGNAVSTSAVSQALQDWGVAAEDSAGQLDLLFRASQETGTPMERLLTLVKQYGAPLRELGFEVDEAAVLLGGFEEAGVNTELAMGGLRTALGKFVGAGRDPQQALAETFTAIEEAGSSSEAAGIAVEVFGRRAGADLAQAISQGRFSFEEMLAVVESGTDTIGGVAEETADLGDRLKMLGNQAVEVVGPFGEIGFALSGVLAVMGPTLTGVGKLTTWLKGTEDAAGGLSRVMSSRLTPAIGGVGAAVALAANAFVEYQQQQANIDASAQTLAAAMLDVSTSAEDDARAFVEAEITSRNLAGAFAESGISVDLLTRAFGGNVEAQAEVERRIGDSTTAVEGFVGGLGYLPGVADSVSVQVTDMGEAFERAGVTAGYLADANEQLVPSLDDVSGSLFGNEVALDKYRESAAAASSATADARAAAASYNGHLDALTTAADAAAATIDVMSTALDRLLGVNISSDEAAIRYLDSLEGLSEAADANGTALDINSDAGRRNREAIIAVIEAANGHIQSMADQGTSLGDLGPVMDQHRQDLIAQATQAGFTTLEIEGLLAQYGLTPETISTAFRTVGVVEAEREVRRFQGMLGEVGDSLASVAADLGIHISAGSGGSGGVMAALGGQIGAGYGTRDDVPALLTRGEFVEPVGRVREPGALPFLEDMRAHGFAQALQRVGFASGGEVLARAFAGNIVAAEMPQGFARALAWFAEQAGEPYIWGGSGPFGWDCSGAMGGAAAVARGLNPNQRYFNTASMIDANGQFGFVPGLQSQFRIGVRKGNPGHMSGTLLGVNIEATPPRVRMGPGARGADNGLYTHRFGLRLAGGGIVDPLVASLFPVGPGDPPFDLLNPNGRFYNPAYRDLVGLAAGGAVTKGGAFLVGEHGPEVAMLRSGDAVAPAGAAMHVIIAGFAPGVQSGAAQAGIPQHVTAAGRPPLADIMSDSFERPQDTTESDAAAAAAQAARDEAAVARGIAAQAAEDAADVLQQMLADRDAIQTRIRDATRVHHRRLAEMERQHAEAQAELARQVARQQQAAVDARTASLSGSIGVDQRLQETWGNTSRALTRNLLAQAEAFAEHRDLLFGLRSRGLDEGLIAALGLEAGPEALGQIRQLMGATDAELAELNAAFVSRSAEVGATVQRESVEGAGALGAQLLALQTQYSGQVQALTAAHVAAVEVLNEQQAALMYDLAAEMAAIGTSMGLSTAEAIAAGIMSGIPAIVAAAQAAADALVAAGLPSGAKLGGRPRPVGIPGGRGAATPGGFDPAAYAASHPGAVRYADWAPPNPSAVAAKVAIAGPVTLVLDSGERFNAHIRTQADGAHATRAYKTAAQAVR